MSTICGGCGKRRARPERNFCSQCYRLGVASDGLEVRPTGLERPDGLRDTGMRIVNSTSTLIIPGGIRIPVPKHFSRKYFFEGNELLIVYERPCQEKRELSTTPQLT